MEDRLVQLLKSEGINPTRFAERIGVQRSSMSHILSGRNKPSYDFIVKILESFPAVSPDWLLRGKGMMYKEDAQKQPGLFDEIPLESGLTEDNSKGLNPVLKTSVAENTPSGISYSKPAAAEDTKFKAPAAIEKKIEKIVIFYSDNTFSDYLPKAE